MMSVVALPLEISAEALTPVAGPLLTQPLLSVLRQLADLLSNLSDGQYNTKPVGQAPGSIGAHVRHCLDHIDAWLAALESGHLDYDERKRGTVIETKRGAALDAFRRQEDQLRGLDSIDVSRRLRLSILVSPALPAQEFDTTVGRELAFVLSHTIHHNALIGVMARTLNVAVPEQFGYAPSTLAHREKQACAR